MPSIPILNPFSPEVIYGQASSPLSKTARVFHAASSTKAKKKPKNHLPTVARNPYSVYMLFPTPLCHGIPWGVDWSGCRRHACLLLRPCVKSDMSQTRRFFSHYYPETGSGEAELMHRGRSLQLRGSRAAYSFQYRVHTTYLRSFSRYCVGRWAGSGSRCSSRSILRCIQDPEGWGTMRNMQYYSSGLALSGGEVRKTFGARSSLFSLLRL